MKPRLSRIAIGVLATLAITTQLAQAGDSGQESTHAAAEPRVDLIETSYKTEILIAHAAPLGLMWTVAILSDGKSSDDYLTAFNLTLPPLILAPPAVHAWHGNWERSAASFGINLVATWGARWILVLEPCDETGALCDKHTFKKAAAVHTLFNGLVTLADVIMADTEPKRQAKSANGAIIQPTLSPLAGGMMLGAQGVF